MNFFRKNRNIVIGIILLVSGLTVGQSNLVTQGMVLLGTSPVEVSE